LNTAIPSVNNSPFAIVFSHVPLTATLSFGTFHLMVQTTEGCVLLLLVAAALRSESALVIYVCFPLILAQIGV
jgi:hypothetical protein